jgi:hypothetical protein
MVDVKALMQAAKNTTALSCEERMALYNSRRGDLTGYDCPICRNKGFVFLMKDGYEYTMECECMEKRRGKWRLKRSGLQDMAERYRFETYEAKTSWQKSILAAAECFCEEREGWFYIGGQVGENAHLHRHCESTDATGQGRALHDLDGGSHQAKSPQDG